MKQQRVIIFIALVLSINLSLSSEVLGDSQNYEYFPHENLLKDKKMESELINPEKFQEFILEDEKYLMENEFSKDDLNKEIAYLDKKIFENEENYVLTKMGVVLYTPNIVGNIYAYELAKRNRKSLRDKGLKNFVYKRDVFYYPQKAVKGSYRRDINPERLLENYRQAKGILDNIELDRKYLENLVVSISPFELAGLNGFTETFGVYNEGTTVVINNQALHLPVDSQEYKNEIKSTVLHELGHAFHYAADRNYKKGEDKIDLDSDFWKEYSEIYDNKLTRSYDSKNKRGWETDLVENFAEDFRFYFSGRIGDYSFDPKPKRTKADYREEVGPFIEKYMEKSGGNQEPGISKSTAKVNGKVHTIDKYEVIEFEKKDEIKLEVEAGSIKRESYIKIWSDNMRPISKVDLQENDLYNYRVRANSNISTIVKYKKMGNEFKPLWRINIVD